MSSSNPARRAQLRHLLAPAQRPHRLFGRGGQPRHCQPRRSAAAGAPESQDAEKDISLGINSPGGEVYSGLAILDTMNYIKPDVSTICVGMAASMAAVLLAGGAKGKRFSLPHSKIMIHQPSGGAQGQQTEIEIAAREIREDAHDAQPDFGGCHGQAVRSGRARHRARQLPACRAGARVRPDRPYRQLPQRFRE